MATKHTGAIHTRVLSQNQYIRKFHETVDSFIGRNHWQVYTDFLQLMMDSFLSDQTPDHPREKDYMDIVRQYKPHEPEKFTQMMNCIFAYMRETNRECISELWEEYASNSMIGQFFTPWHLCQLNADLLLKNLDWEKYTPENPCYISDPSCGGGRAFIASLKRIPLSKMDSICFCGIDVDHNVCLVAALNMLFFNASSYVIHGNALTMEVWHVFRTIHHLGSGGEIVEITDPEKMQQIISIGFSKKGDL
jgi:type I restriction-modification system DNA methylase subunit